MKNRDSRTLELVRFCCRALDEKKASDLRVLDVRKLSSITDYLVIATATSDPHLRAMRQELEKVLEENGTSTVRIETAEHSGWTIVDLFDVMIHLFRGDIRTHYGLENLWKDAAVVSLPLVAGTDSKASRPKPAKASSGLKKAVARPKTRKARR